MFTHLKRYGINPAEITIQTDNGTEFIAPWNSLRKTLFTKIIEVSFTSTLNRGYHLFSDPREKLKLLPFKTFPHVK